MGTMKVMGATTHNTVIDSAGRQINFLSPHQLDALITAIRERETQVNVAPSDAVIEVNVESEPPNVKVTNEVTPADVTVNSTHIVEFSVKHVYYAILLNAILTFALGIGAYVAISQLDQYLESRDGSRSELSLGF